MDLGLLIKLINYCKSRVSIRTGCSVFIIIVICCLGGYQIQIETSDYTEATSSSLFILQKKVYDS